KNEISQMSARTIATMNNQCTVKPMPNAMIASTASTISRIISVLLRRRVHHVNDDGRRADTSRPDRDVARPGRNDDSGGRCLVDARAEHAARRALRQQLVRVRLLVERLLEQVAGVVEPELSRERPGSAVRRDLVVLDALRRRDDRGVLRNRIAGHVDDLL